MQHSVLFWFAKLQKKAVINYIYRTNISTILAVNICVHRKYYEEGKSYRIIRPTQSNRLGNY